MSGTVVKKGYRKILEKAIEAVHIELGKLWKKYNLVFMNYLHYDDKELQKKQRELFYRGILLEDTKVYIKNTFDGREISNEEDYWAGYDSDKNWPVIIFDQYEVSNSSSIVLMDYIIKTTEKVVREHLGIKNKFTFNNKKLYDLFPEKIFKDNLDNNIIGTTIESTVNQVCQENGI